MEVSRLATTKQKRPASGGRQRRGSAPASHRSGRRSSSRWWWPVLLIGAIAAGAAYYYRAPIQGYTGAGTAYAARVGCSCRFVAGRDIEDCEKDRIAGMEAISLSEDLASRSVTASFPLLKSDTATYREGYGCVLQEYRD